MPAKQSTASKTSGTEYAGFWLRVVAAIIDGILLSIVVWIASFGFSAQPGMMFGMSSGGGGLRFLLGLAYFVVMESSQYQGTFGKVILGLKVTDLAGKRISALHALGRYLAKILSVITIGIGFLMAGFTAKKQALHDMIAGTLVVRGEAK